MNFRLTWTLGGDGVQVDLDIGDIDFDSKSIQLYLCYKGGHEL